MATLLEVVRGVNMEMNPGEYIHTIDETPLTTYISKIVIDNYFNIIDGRDWPHLYQLFSFIGTSSSTPTHMTIPDNVMDLKYVKYNARRLTDTKDKYVDIVFKEPKEFMSMLDNRDSSALNIDLITDSNGIKFNVFNDRPPKYYTSLNDKGAVFDSYDIAVESFLSTNKTQVHGKIYPTLEREDNSVINLPVDSTNYLINKVKAYAYLTIRQQQNPEAEREATTQRRRMSQEANKIKFGIDYPNYGRRGIK